MDEKLHIILPNGDADEAIEALEEAGIDCEYLDDTHILVDMETGYGSYEDVLDDAVIDWDIA